MFHSSGSIEVNGGWFNSEVHPIHCVGLGWVCDTYILSYFSSWQQYLRQSLRTRNTTPSDNFPSRVVVRLDSTSRSSRQVRKYFDVPFLIVLLMFCSIFLLVIFSIVILASSVSLYFFSIVSLVSTVFLAFILLFSSFLLYGVLCYS